MLSFTLSKPRNKNEYSNKRKLEIRIYPQTTYPHNYDTQYGTIGFLDLDNGDAHGSVYLIGEDGIEPFDWEATPPWKLRR